MLARVRHSWNYTGDPEITLTQESDRGEIDRLRALLSGFQEKPGNKEQKALGSSLSVTEILADRERGTLLLGGFIDELAVFTGDAERLAQHSAAISL